MANRCCRLKNVPFWIFGCAAGLGMLPVPNQRLTSRFKIKVSKHPLLSELWNGV